MTDWTTMGDRIFEVLEFIHARKTTFTAEAHRRGITLNQLIAAALAGMMQEEIEGTNGRNQAETGRFRDLLQMRM
jgi:hypothetical protein